MSNFRYFYIIKEKNHICKYFQKIFHQKMTKVRFQQYSMFKISLPDTSGNTAAEDALTGKTPTAAHKYMHNTASAFPSWSSLPATALPKHLPAWQLPNGHTAVDCPHSWL